MARGLSTNKLLRLPHKKRTSIGRNARVTNKSKRRSFKRYRGQGR